jgi:hypothetical protein
VQCKENFSKKTMERVGLFFPRTGATTMEEGPCCFDRQKTILESGLLFMIDDNNEVNRSPNPANGTRPVFCMGRGVCSVGPQPAGLDQRLATSRSVG